MIKWGILQPLTGGMYLGTKSATGCDAQWILSYPGLDKTVKDKNGDIVSAANEYHITEYLKEHNCMPKYYLFDRQMFQNDFDLSPVIKTKEGEVETPDYADMDLVVAVPVCSGLSTVTICDDSVRQARNSNMLYLAKYTLNVIKPKVYIFENAPTLFSSRGTEVRAQLEQFAADAGYTIAYYKTDTHLHHNCQKRPRTFVYFFKGDCVPQLEFENAPVSVDEFMSQIPESAGQRDELQEYVTNTVPIKYNKYLFGENWRDNVSGDIFLHVIKSDETINQFMDWLNKNGNEEEITVFTKYITHIKKKLADGKGFWVVTPRLYKDFIPACLHKNIWAVLHHKEDRLYNAREWMTVMGMPYDFHMYGLYKNYAPLIGQNVPAGTAKFIVSQAVKYLENKLTLNNVNKMTFDNIKQKII